MSQAHGVPSEGGDPAEVCALLGGQKVLHRRIASPLDAHDLLLRGLPARALEHFVRGLGRLANSDGLEGAMGMSLRTYQRRREADAKPLSREQSGRLWKFAEILAQATSVFGSQAQAETWLEGPALALEQRRPIDLLATPAGAEMVQAHLGRLAYGVYT